MVLTLWALWVPALNRGEVKVPKLFIWPLLLPVISLTVFLALASLSGPVSFSALGFPVLLLIFALVLLGGQQNRLSNRQWLTIVLIVCIGVLPQSFFTLNDIGIIDKDFVLERMPVLFVRSFLGFSQYNLMGSFLASLVIFIGWSLYSLKVRNIWAILLLQVLSCYFALILSLNGSKTGFLGMFGAATGLLAYAVWQDRDIFSDQKKWLQPNGSLTSPHCLLIVWFALICLTVSFDSWVGGQITKLLAALPISSEVNILNSVDGLNQRWEAGIGAGTRFSMWYVAWDQFLEAPFMGHGLGSFHEVYLRAYADYGLQENLKFNQNLENPHNLVLFLLVETGLVGLITILGPYLYALTGLIRHNAKNILVLIVLFPILLHTQLEYPYIQSSTHFWLFAILLTAVTQINAQKDEPVQTVSLSRGTSLLNGATMTVLGAAFIAVAYSTAYQDALAAHRYKVMQVKSLGEILARRFTHSDLTHPVVGANNLDTTLIYLTERATREGQLKMLDELLLPLYEDQVSDKYSAILVWHVEYMALLALGKYDKAEKMIKKIDRFTPEYAQEMRDIIKTYREEATPPPPQQAQ